MVENNEEINHLQDYEIETPDKKGFFATLLDKIKRSQSQKLLNSGSPEKTPTTSRSISSLWNLGNLRASLVSTLDHIHHIFSKETSSIQNTMPTEIIGDTTKKPNQQLEKVSDEQIQIQPIIPSPVKSDASEQKQSTIPLEVAHIDTSAITDKEKEKKDSDKNKLYTEKNNQSVENKTTHELDDDIR